MQDIPQNSNLKITPAGENIDILLLTRYDYTCDWLTFSSFYSIKKNIPDANVCVISLRDLASSVTCFNWCFRLRVPFFQIKSIDESREFSLRNKIHALNVAKKRGFIRNSALILEPQHFALRSFDAKILDYFSRYGLGQSNTIMYFNQNQYESLDSALNNKMTKDNALEFSPIPQLCCDSNSNDISSFCRINKCGKLNLENWSGKKIQSPFNVADHLLRDSITLNEQKILQLWSKMKYLYYNVR